MTRRELYALRETIDNEKIKNATAYIFSYLDKEGFNLFEITCLTSSMGNVLNHIKKNGPLRMLKEFDYSSSITELFSASAISKTES